MKEKTLAKLKFLVIAVGIALILVGCGTSNSGRTNDSDKDTEGTITLKVASFVTEKSFVHRVAVEPWMSRVTELTDGQVVFDLYPAEQLGKAGDTLNLTRDNVADIGVTDLAYFSDELPLSTMLANLPIYRDTTFQSNMAYYDLVHKDEESSDIMQQEFADNGVRHILSRISPSHSIWTKGKEIRVPEDLKGVRIRTGGGPVNKMYEDLGAVPTTIHFPDIYEAVEREVVEAVHLFGIAMNTSGSDELVSYGLETGRGGSTLDSIFINEKTWNSLPKNVQEAINQAGEEVTEEFGQINDDEAQSFNEGFIENGGTIAELTDEEKKKWEEFSSQFIETWMETNKSSNEHYESILDLYNKQLELYK